MVKVRERGVPRRGTRPSRAPGARGRTTSHHRAPNMAVETRARGRGADSSPQRGMSAAPLCQSGSGRLARTGGRKQVLGKLIIYIPVERASRIRQLSSSASPGEPNSRDAFGRSSGAIYLYGGTKRESGPPYVTNPIEERQMTPRSVHQTFATTPQIPRKVSVLFRRGLSVRFCVADQTAIKEWRYAVFREATSGDGGRQRNGH